MDDESREVPQSVGALGENLQMLNRLVSKHFRLGAGLFQSEYRYERRLTGLRVLARFLSDLSRVAFNIQ